MVSTLPKIEAIVGREFPEKVIPLIEQSKTSIDIVVFDWRWYPHDPSNPAQIFNQSVIQAYRRGVKIRVVANSEFIKSVLENIGIEVKRLMTPNLVHVKLMIIDNETAILGSHNYTQNAFTLNYELSAILRGREEIKRMVEFFNNIYG